MYDKYKICPKCNSLIDWDSYFGAYTCRQCGNIIYPEITCPNCKSDDIGKFDTESFIKAGNKSLSSVSVCRDCGTVFVPKKYLK